MHAPYAAGLLRTLQLRHSVGFIGGRPSHALYFVGARGRVLHGLDPHTTQVAYTLPERTARVDGVEPVPPADGTFLCDAHVSSMNCWGSGGGSGPNEMCVDSLDPSLALGFYCADRADFEAFSESVARLAADSKSRGEPPLFSVDLVTEPTPEEATAQGSAQELLLVDDDRDDADGGGAEDEEDDFVLV